MVHNVGSQLNAQQTQSTNNQVAQTQNSRLAQTTSATVSNGRVSGSSQSPRSADSGRTWDTQSESSSNISNNQSSFRRDANQQPNSTQTDRPPIKPSRSKEVVERLSTIVEVDEAIIEVDEAISRWESNQNDDAPPAPPIRQTAPPAGHK